MVFCMFTWQEVVSDWQEVILDMALGLRDIPKLSQVERGFSVLLWWLKRLHTLRVYIIFR